MLTTILFVLALAASIWITALREDFCMALYFLCS